MSAFKCEYCDNTFNRKKDLAKHTLDNHRNDITSHEKDELKRLLNARKNKGKGSFNKNLLIIPVVLFLLLGVGFFVLSPTGNVVKQNKTETASMGEFVECLNETSVLYTTKDCPVCKEQKELIGDSIQHLEVVECDKNQQLCEAIEIESVPAWNIDGKRYVGKKSLGELSDLSMCALPK